jgi:hypothetical protein
MRERLLKRVEDFALGHEVFAQHDSGDAAHQGCSFPVTRPNNSM